MVQVKKMKNKEKIILYIWLSSLIIIILVGVMMCFQRPSEKIIEANKEVLMLAGKIRTYYSNRPDYWGLGNSEVIKQKLYPGKINNNQIMNNLGKIVNIGSDGNGTPIMPGVHNFIISYQKLNQKECIELASFHWSEEDRLGLISITIQNTKGSYEFSWGDKGLPLSKGMAKQYCKEENKLLWSFE